MHRNHRLVKIAVLFLGMIFFFAAGSAMAQVKFGLRLGGTIDPDQFHFGGHIITDPLFENFTFRPNLEVGVGSSVTTISTNFEFVYEIPIEKKPVSLYVGIGPALNIYSHSDSNSNGGDTSVGGGLNILFGIQHESGFMGEMKVGTIDSPDLKFTVGYTFQ